MPWLVYQFLYSIIMLFGPSLIAYFGIGALLINYPYDNFKLLLGLIPVSVGLLSLYFWVHVKIFFDQLLKASRLPEAEPSPPPPPPQPPQEKAAQPPLTIAVMSPYSPYDKNYSMYDGGYLYGQEFVQSRHHKASGSILGGVPPAKIYVEEFQEEKMKIN